MFHGSRKADRGVRPITLRNNCLLAKDECNQANTPSRRINGTSEVLLTYAYPTAMAVRANYFGRFLWRVVGAVVVACRVFVMNTYKF